jgi:hypothetical protein
MKKIYILIEVTYDYYAFKENAFAHIDRDKVVEHYNGLNADYPLIEDEVELSEYLAREKGHFEIEEWDCD